MKPAAGLLVAAALSLAGFAAGCGADGRAGEAPRVASCEEPAVPVSAAEISGDYVLDLRSKLHLATSPEVLKLAEQQTSARIEAFRDSGRNPMPLPIPLTDAEVANLERSAALPLEMSGVEDVLRANSATTLWWRVDGTPDSFAVTILVTDGATDATRGSLAAAVPATVPFVIAEAPASADQVDAAVNLLNRQFVALHDEPNSGASPRNNLFAALEASGLAVTSLGYTKWSTNIVIGIDGAVTGDACEALANGLETTGLSTRLEPVTVSLQNVGIAKASTGSVEPQRSGS